MAALDHVDGVDLEPPHVLHEGHQGRGREPPRPRPSQVLALQEESGHGTAAEERGGHGSGPLTVQCSCRVATTGARPRGPAPSSWFARLPEARTLQRELAGYGDYAARARYRLLAGLW